MQGKSCLNGFQYEVCGVKYDDTEWVALAIIAWLASDQYRGLKRTSGSKLES